MSLISPGSDSSNSSSYNLPTQSFPLRKQAISGNFDGQVNNVATQPGEPSINPMELRHLSESLRILPVPSVTDDLETTAKKIIDLANVVKDGNSLALWTGLKLASPHARDPESLARSQMPPDERRQYDTWKRIRDRRVEDIRHGKNEITQDTHVALRDFDWVNNVAPVPQGAQSLKKFSQRAQAMDIIWDHQGATPENASWLTFNLASLLPLVKAVCRVQNAEKHYRNNYDPHTRGLTDMEVAEIETVRKIVSIAERNRTRELEKIRKLTRSINESVAIIKGRIQLLEDKMKK